MQYKSESNRKSDLYTEHCCETFQYMWRLTTRGHVRPGYPTKFRQMFHGFPDEVKNIDAVYERPDSNLVFFSGKVQGLFSVYVFLLSRRWPIKNQAA